MDTMWLHLPLEFKEGRYSLFSCQQYGNAIQIYLRMVFIYYLVFRKQGRVAHTLIKFKCQLNLNGHLQILEMYMKLIYT